MKKGGFLCVFSLIGLLLSAQFPYQLSKPRDLSLSAAGLVLSGTGLLLKSQIEPLTPSERAALDAQVINRLDRPIIQNWNRSAQKVSDVVAVGSVLSPFALLAGEDGRNQAFTIAVMGFEAYSLTQGLTLWSKVITRRPRPFMYNNLAANRFYEERGSRLSFFSGHSSMAAVGCFFGAKVYQDLYPDSPWRWPIWGMAACIPAFTAYLRVKGGKHFLTDVITGYTVGALIGWGIPALHKRANGAMSIHPMPNGIMVRF